MSVLPQATYSAPGVPLYGGGGGGGGSSSTITTLYASTINVSTVSSEFITNASTISSEFVVVNDQLSVQNNFFVGGQGNNTLIYGTSGNLNLSAAGASTINLAIDNNITAITSAGISTNGLLVNTINGVPFVAQPNGRATVANAGNIYVPAAGTTQPVAAFSTVVGHLYQLEVPNLRVQNQPVGQPVAGAWADITIDTTPTVTYLDTFDMESVSSIINDLQKAPVYSFVATAAGHNLTANGITTNTLSTALTFAPQVFLRDLGSVASMPVIG